MTTRGRTRDGGRQAGDRAGDPCADVRVDVLGPVAVTVDGVVRPLPAPRQRALLACLAVHAGEALSADRLLGEVWGEQLPDTGRGAVQYQIARLRSLLEPNRIGQGTLIVSSPGGYRLAIAPERVDALRFEQLVARGRELLASDPVACEELMVQALQLWKGRPFADLDGEPFVERSTRRLEQRHLLAQRTVAQAQIETGRAVEAVDDLERLADEHPLDESLVGLLMQALQRSGRAADALAVYGELRRRLSGELGIEPSGELQRLELELLDGRGSLPPRSAAGRPPVPSAVSSFVGREEELAGIDRWLSATRLVTICGFGGLGKTRLARELAQRIGDRFADGVWYVDLAAVLDPAELPVAILTAGGSKVPPDGDPVRFLESTLAGSHALLVLDNCEHLVGGLTALIDRVLPSAPRLRVLATSRVRLGLDHESVWALRPLDAPSALGLFLERARLARPGFLVDGSERLVERLVARFDGIPLAIEIAAARLAMMGIVELDEHLDDRLLTRSERDTDRRQHSVVEVVEWSYQLLGDADRVFLQRMSMCAGGFDLDAAIVIGGLDPNTDGLDRLGRLVEASLLVFDCDEDVARYRMLEPIRGYVAGKLDERERYRTGLIHARHYEAIANRVFDLAGTHRSTETRIGRLELGNLRAAIAWAYRNGLPELGLSIAGRARLCFFERLLDRELLDWLEVGLELVDTTAADVDVVLQAVAAAVVAASSVSEEEARDRYARWASRGFDGVVDPTLRADLLSARANPLVETDPRAAEAYTDAAIDLRSPASWRASAYLTNRVDESWFSGALDDGEVLLQRLAEIRAAVPEQLPEWSKIEAGVAAGEGRWDDVVRIARSARDLDLRIAAAVDVLHAEALAALGRLDEATTVLARVDPNSQEFRQSASLVGALIELRRGEPEAAVEQLGRVAHGRAAHGDSYATGVQIASLLAIAAHALGQHDAAATLFGHSAAGQDRLDIRLRPSYRTLAGEAIESCRAELGPQRFDELADRGARTAWRDLPAVEIGRPHGPARRCGPGRGAGQLATVISTADS